ncbi:putative conserved cation transport regulator [Mesorhizobium plurifarium]|uniref:Putative conserved cation transport regulator n=1 Tax=Mesorhizobium plurifarium TaxID=69974 RepID=A0A090GAV9_MESPL|nr:putative conserved cation transport regulator [Mesorhizobium plurifarium]
MKTANLVRPEFWNAAVPYASIEDLPPPIREYLPLHAREIYRAAFNNAWDEYVDRGAKREEIAHRVAWAAVKHRYRKERNEWVPL